jgi:hypothetical protein
MKSFIIVILSSPLGEYRRMKPKTKILSVKDRLLRQRSFVRNLAMTMRFPEFGFSYDLSEKIKPTIPAILSDALALYRRVKLIIPLHLISQK